LSDILWKGQSLQETRNLRGVTIRKLRMVLEALDKVEILFQADIWSMKLSSGIFCDYVECLSLLDNKLLHESHLFKRFHTIIEEGEIFKGDSYPWLDDVKGYIGNQIVDVLLNFLETRADSSEHELILALSEQVLIYDPVNDTALSLKMKALIKQNNHHLARFTYDRFCGLFEEMYGEKFNKTFNQLIS
jgi:two-component SAPR family response regulator